MPRALKPLCLTQVGRIQSSHFQPSSLWGNKNWVPKYKDVEVGKFWEQNWLNRLQMVQFECSRHSNPVSHSGGENSLFPFSAFLSQSGCDRRERNGQSVLFYHNHCRVIRIGLPSIKMYRSCKILGINLA